MLEHIDVHNLALATKSSIDFQDGFICITGETGAGKSLVVDALSFVLGARADSNIIRDGEDKCEICAAFTLDKTNKKLIDFLEEQGLLDDSDESVIIRRIINKEGKSKAYINDHLTTLTNIKELGSLLVSIHGQHASVKLLDSDNQLRLLDNFAKLKDFVNKVNSAFSAYNVKRKELTDLATLQKSEALVYKNLRYELEELKKLDLKEGDYEELERDFDRAVHQEQLVDSIALAYASLSNDESNIIDVINARVNDLQKVLVYDKERLDPVMELFNNALINLDEARESLQGILSSQERISSIDIETKMSKCHELSRRFGIRPHDLYAYQETLESRIENFLSLKDKIASCTEEVKGLRQVYEDLAHELYKKRLETSTVMSDKVSASIKTLAMADGVFKVELNHDTECKPKLNGRDSVRFLFSANLGQEVKDLASVASGGELSRLALAIEVLTSQDDGVKTLIFDEVDTGISGRTASSVGALLKELGTRLQVITVTHLPQVAAQAQSQYLVHKYNEGNSVNSKIERLDRQGRIEELSRMMGGNVITEDTRRSATALLDGCANV